MNLAIFASGSGTNAENIIEYFKNQPDRDVKLVLCNNKSAGVLSRAEKHGVETYLFDREMARSGQVLQKLEDAHIGFIILAGYLWLMPADIVRSFPKRILNIHPALLPKYGGKGMYGMNVHHAVVENRERESGITVHYVNEEYDKGNIIFQAKCPVLPSDTPEDVAHKVHQLEYEHFPKVIEGVLRKL
jgi:phosphoribosylglycinamide formyltransferase 1